MARNGWKATLASLAGLLASAAIMWAQGTQAATAPAQPSEQDRLARAMMQFPNTALGQKAALEFSLMGKWSQVPDLEGSGPFPASYAMAPNGLEFVVYQPIDLAGAASKGKLGVYVWGNGGCAADAASSRFHLTEIASRGYVVIAPGKILSGPKAPPQPEGMRPGGMPAPGSGATAAKMTAAVDWILAESKREGSSYYGAIDSSRIAMAGFSCGGLIAIQAAMDPRVTALLIESSGILKDPPPGGIPNIPQMSAVKKEDLAKLHTPVIYILGGPEDIAEPNGLDDFQHIQQVPVFVADQPGAGHGGLISVPNAEGTKVEIDWLNWQFNHDEIAGSTFIGPNCELCRDFRWEVHRKGIQ